VNPRSLQKLESKNQSTFNLSILHFVTNLVKIYRNENTKNYTYSKII